MRPFFSARYLGKIAKVDFVWRRERPSDFSCSFMMFQDARQLPEDLKVMVTARK